MGLAARPTELLNVQLDAAKQWTDFWTGAMSGNADRETARPALFAGMAGRPLLPRDPRRLSAGVEAVARHGREDRWRRLARRDGALPARPISERHLARPTSPRPIPRSSSGPRRPAAQNLVQGFANLLEDVGSGKGIVQRRTDPERLQEGRDDRRDAGRGRLRKRAVPADPVHADDGQGRGRAVALRAAAGEPLLHDRPGAATEPGQMAGRRRPDGVRDQLGQSRRRA